MSGCVIHGWPLPGIHPEGPIPHDCPLCLRETVERFDRESGRDHETLTYERDDDLRTPRTPYPWLPSWD